MIGGEISLWSVKAASEFLKALLKILIHLETYPESWQLLLMCLNFSILHWQKLYCNFILPPSACLCVVIHLMLKNLSYLRPRLSFLFCICTVPGVMRSQSISEVRILKQLLIQMKTLYLILFFFFAYPAKNWPKSVPLRIKSLCCLWYFRRKVGRETYQTLATRVMLCSWPFLIDITDTVASNTGSCIIQNFILFSHYIKELGWERHNDVNLCFIYGKSIFTYLPLSPQNSKTGLTTV